MSDPNEKQVGGDHYKGVKFQPWDWDKYGIGYLEISAIEYLHRYKRKGGVLDLGKAIHYIEKLKFEKIVNGRFNRTHLFYETLEKGINEYCNESRITGDNREVVKILVTWQRMEDLDTAIKLINRIQKAYEDATNAVRDSERVESAASK